MRALKCDTQRSYLLTNYSFGFMVYLSGGARLFRGACCLFRPKVVTYRAKYRFVKHVDAVCVVAGFKLYDQMHNSLASVPGPLGRFPLTGIFHLYSTYRARPQDAHSANS